MLYLFAQCYGIVFVLSFVLFASSDLKKMFFVPFICYYSYSCTEGKVSAGGVCLGSVLLASAILLSHGNCSMYFGVLGW